MSAIPNLLGKGTSDAATTVQRQEEQRVPKSTPVSLPEDLPPTTKASGAEERNFYEACRKALSGVSSTTATRLAGLTSSVVEQGPRFSCDVCHRTFFLECSLLGHACKGPFVCKTCFKSFARKDILRNHLGGAHSSQPDKLPGCYACELCPDKLYRSKTGLDKHVRSKHTGEGYVACGTCGKRVLRESLRVHVRTHTKERPHVCEICGLGFSARYTLGIHLRTHTQEKPHVCELCQKAFAQRGNLQAHVLSHTQEPSFACGVCRKAFYRRTSLDKHFRTHSKGR